MKSIYTLWDQHLKTRQGSIPLVASENSASRFVRTLLLADFGNRYYIPKEENQSGSWDYPRQELVSEVIEYTRQLAIHLFKGSQASLSALSGNQCVAGILFGLTKWGDTVLGIGPSEGGHWALSKLSERLGVHVRYIPFDYSTHEIDLDKLDSLVQQTSPRFIMLDASHTLFPYPVSDIFQITGSQIPLFYDVSHTFGIIAGGAVPNPLTQGATCIHGSTHKSMFGPQKGLLVFNRDGESFAAVEGALHPILASNIHLDHIAALAGALEELAEFGTEYAERVVSNAKHLGSSLANLGVDLPYAEKGFTETHQLWVPIADKSQAEKLFREFQECGILVNLVQLPFNLGVGFRIGTAEITRLGYLESDVEEIAFLIANLLFHRSTTASIRSSAQALAFDHSEYDFCYLAERVSYESGLLKRIVGN